MEEKRVERIGRQNDPGNGADHEIGVAYADRSNRVRRGRRLYMQLLDQFISQIGKKPADWTRQDVQIYLD